MVWNRCLFAIVVCSSAGCMANYTMRPVEVIVTDPKTNEPVADVPVSVRYSFMKLSNPPQEAQGRTDASGRVVLPIADFDHGEITFEAGGNQFILDSARVRGCGVLKRCRADYDTTKPELAVRLVPHTKSQLDVSEKPEK